MFVTQIEVTLRTTNQLQGFPLAIILCVGD